MSAEAVQPEGGEEEAEAVERDADMIGEAQDDNQAGVKMKMLHNPMLHRPVIIILLLKFL